MVVLGIIKYIFIIVLYCSYFVNGKPNKRQLLIYTAASVDTDGYYRFLRSLEIYGLKGQAKTLGLYKQVGGYSFKIRMLKKAIEKYKDQNNVLILFTDSFDVIFTGGEEEILNAFDKLNAKIVFSAENNCWPDKTLEDLYPEVNHGYRFLNSGGVIGYAPYIYKMLPDNINDTKDDQLFYTRIFLDENQRRFYNMTLDTQATIFQSLHNEQYHISFIYLDDDTKLYNNYTETMPIILHANGNSKLPLHAYSNYLAKSWTISKGCLQCKENIINLKNMPVDSYPIIVMGIFIDRPSPFLEEKLDKIYKLIYPKKKIRLFFYNKIFQHERITSAWANKVKYDYLSMNYIGANSEDQKNITSRYYARLLAMKQCHETKCNIIFIIDSSVHVENQETLNLLVSYNRTVLAPIMLEPETGKANFFGDICDNNTYLESFDYKYIVSNERRNIWKVVLLRNIYVIHRSVLWSITQMNHNYPDITLSESIRTFLKYSTFLYATNLDYYGYLNNMDEVMEDNLYNDLWQVTSNKRDWEKRYLNSQYYENLNSKIFQKMICPDVYLIPLFTKRFCQEMVSSLKYSGLWSDGQNIDERLYSGYENVPAFDIHMTQIGFEKEWFYIVKKYIKPFAEKLYNGYHSKGESIHNYAASFNETLLPHNDIGTYSVLIALNGLNKDYQGGSIEFLRYNCSVENGKTGWAIMHPGRLTHYHRQLPITNGTKYVLVSYIDP